MKKLLDLLSENLTIYLALFLLAFIPLYPKLPLFDIVHTWVYIRAEDFLVLIANILLVYRYWRRSTKTDTLLNIPIAVFLLVGLLVLVNAVFFVFPTLAGGYFPHLAVLHYLRRIEYISLFFLTYHAVRQKGNIKPFVWVLVLTFIGVLGYGFGQKFFGWPAFMTMNEEFAKGLPLRLPPTARIPSTFGGHYDLAAYLVLMIPVIGSLAIGVRKITARIFYILLAVAGLVMLLLTASRISFGVYLLSVSAMLIARKKYLLVPIVIIISIILMNLTSGASERFYKTLRFNDVVVDLSTGKPIGTLDKLEGASALIEDIEKPDEESLPKGSGFIGAGSISKANTSQISQIKVYKSQDLASASGEIATISGSFLIQKAFVYDISITTRFQGQWPKASEAFKRNILFGSGYSSLSLAADGDYHRMLGESGLLGAISFLGIIAVVFFLLYKYSESLPEIPKSISYGVFGGLTGLMFNAVLIDVFEASKVAFSMWMLIGMSLAFIKIKFKITWNWYFKFLYSILVSKQALIIYLIVITYVIWSPSLSVYFIGDDFTWLKWAAESSFKDIPSFFTNAGGFFFRPIPKLWYTFLFSIFWLKPGAYHTISLLIVSATTVGLYFFLINMKISRFWALIASLVFSGLGVHHENIFWISSQGSLLAGLFFVFSLNLLFVIYRFKIIEKFSRILGILMLFFAMLSYEGAVVLPLIIWILGLRFFGYKKLWYLILVMIPGYLVIRYFSGALGFFGDYNIKTSTFIVNSIANSIGYTAAIIFGPGIMDIIAAFREISRPYLLEYTLSAVVIIVVVAINVWIKKSIIYKHMDIFILVILYLLSFSSYLGLGGIAERYAYIPSMFLIIIAVKMIDNHFKNLSWIYKILLFITLFLFFKHQLSEINHIASHWQKAGEIVENTMLMIKKQTFPPKEYKSFFFINTPIRYGRAWIFPTGLNDAIWHMYRLSPFQAQNSTSLEEAFATSVPLGDREVFIFENYVLKRGIEVRD